MITMYTFIFFILLKVLHAQDQNNDGKFYYPKNDDDSDEESHWDSFMRVQEGAAMQIKWVTDYMRINLHWYNINDISHYKVITTNYAGDVWNWEAEVICGQNFSEPFRFHLINSTQGNDDDQSNGGVWSGAFWIDRKDPASPSVSECGSTHATASTAVTSTATTDTTITATPTQEVHSTSGSSPKLSGGGVAGSVIGGLIGLAIICAALLFLLKRHRKRQSYVIGPADMDEYRPAPTVERTDH